MRERAKLREIKSMLDWEVGCASYTVSEARKSGDKERIAWADGVFEAVDRIRYAIEKICKEYDK